MDCYEARLESFHKTRRVKTKTGTVVLKWPHPDTYLATPEQLAEAGFYYSPTVEARDSVKCFMCRKELDEWDEDDDPISVHFARCRDICAWAVARCGNVEDLDANGGFTFKDPSRAPTSKTMEKARHETFASSWPHDHIRGHGASSKKMAKAGFLYAPHSAGDDTAICVYCTTTLSGWDADDDPLEEHRKRVAKSGRRCAFFEMLEGSSKTTQPPRATKSMSRSTSQSLSKKKSEAVLTTPEEEPSSDDMSELTVLTTAKSKRTTRSSSVPTKTPGSRKSTRSGAASSRSKGTTASEIDEDAEGSGSEVGKRVSKSKKKGMKKAKEVIESIVEVDEGEDLGGVAEEPVVQKPKRGRPPGKSKAAAKVKKAAESVPDESEVEPPPDKPPRARSRSKVAVESDSEPPTNTKPPSSQPKTKSSTKHKKVEEPPMRSEEPRRTASSHDIPDDELMPPPKTKPKAKVTASGKSKAIEVESDDDDVHPSQPPAQEPRKPNKKTPPSRSVEEKPLSNGLHADAPVSQAKGRKSSSTSDDTGYATAEQPMEVDDEHPSRERSQSRGASLREKPDKRSTSAAKAPVMKTEPDTDVDMQDASELPRESRPRQLSNAKAPAPIPRQLSKSSLNPAPRMASRSTSSLARPPSRIGTEIVDISSDEDDELDVLKVIASSRSQKPLSTSSAGSGTEPPVSIAPSSSGAFVPSRISKQSPPSDPDTVQRTLSNRSVALPEKISDRKPTVVSPAALPHVSPDIEMERVEEPRVKPPSAAKDKTRPKQSPSTPSPPPSDTLPSRPTAPQAPPLPSFDEDLAAEEARTKDPAVEAFTPFLSITSVSNLTALTEDEGDLTLEQYIRRELERQYQQFKEDGDRQIALFKQRAAEARKMIESL